MRHFCFIPVFILVVISSVATASDRRHHQQGHPNAAEIVPPTWRAQSDPNWRGRRYVSPDGSSWFVAYATPADREPTQTGAIRSETGEQITYEKHERDWGAISGFKGSKIFYRKAVLACGGKTWHEIAFEYPAARKVEMDPFVIRASRNIDHAENDSCE
jgi:hypothetical protein